MVRLKLPGGSVVTNAATSFNSSMVRLKQDDQGNEIECFDRFNSSMVRLKQYYFDKKKHGVIVSIPLWYD